MTTKVLPIAGALLLLLGTRGAAQPRYFTVADSIEMTRFDRIDPHVLFSPDKRYFAIVSSRGILRTNTVESTLWLFPTAKVEAFLRHSGAPPTPRALARLAAVPEADADTSYWPVITNLKWQPDSQAILFLGQGANGARRLYRVSILSGSEHVLTPAGYDVVAFDTAHDTITYQATQLPVPRPVGDRINADAVDVTKYSAVYDILFPAESISYSDLWVLHHRGAPYKVDGDDSLHRLRLLNNGEPVLSIAPDGHAAIAVVPVEKTVHDWSNYLGGYAGMRINPDDPNSIAESNYERLLQYALVDFSTNTVTPLIQAPISPVIGGGVFLGAGWSPSGTKVVVIDTFLPFESVDTAEQARRRHSCIAAVVDVASNATSCIAFDTYASATGEHGSIVESAAFESTDNDVVLRMMHEPTLNESDDHYRYENGAWTLIASTPASQSSDPFAVVVKQDLNTPPALWATDPRTHVTRKLWDPNPQLAEMNLGKVSVFHWRDASGREWTGGLVLPPGYVAGHRYPFVIQTHGFDASEFMTDGIYTTAFAARPLASAGIIVLQVDDDYEHIEQGAEAHDNVRGYESVIARLNAMGLIDPRRVGIIGFSRTCWYAETALIDDPHLFAAASISDGVDQSYMQYLLFDQTEGNTIWGTPPFGSGLATWVKKAPGFQLYRVQAPLLITAILPGSILGEWEIYASLRVQKKPVDMIYIPDGQHILQKPLDRMASQQSNVDWFRFWLQGYEDPNPAKAAQYRRWESLRKLQ